jgi:hypothetical protein
MDDPLRWGKVRRAINRAIEKHKLATEEGIRGSSLVTMIFKELQAHGHVVADDQEDENDRGPDNSHAAGQGR